MSGYLGVNSQARKISKLYVGVNGTARKVKKAYTGDASGKARLWYSSGTALSRLAVGSTIRLQESSTTAEFVVAQHGYNTGRLLVVRKTNLPDQVVWDQPNYSNEDTDRQWGFHSGRYAYLRTWLNSTYLGRFSNEMQAAIGTTSYSYNAPGDGLGLHSDSTAVFVLSAAEIFDFKGAGYISNPNDGTLLPAAARSAITADGGSWWTRSICTQTFTADDGSYYNRVLLWNGSTITECSENDPDNQRAWVRPCFTLPETLEVDDTGLVKGA